MADINALIKIKAAWGIDLDIIIVIQKGHNSFNFVKELGLLIF